MHILNSLFNNIYVLYIKEEEVYSIKKVISELNINVQYFLGFDGSKEQYTLPPNIKKGEYGHLNSFINILTDAKHKGYENILILEPDIYLCKDFSNILLTYGENFIRESDILYLGCTQNKFYSENTWPKINIIDNKYFKYYKAYKTLGTFAVSIKNTVYQELLNILGTFSSPTDVLFTKIQEKEKYKSIVLYPNLISCNVVQSGTKGILNYRNQIKFSIGTRWNLREYDYVNHYSFNNLNPETKYTIQFTINSKLLNKDIEITIMDSITTNNIKNLIFSKKDKIYAARRKIALDDTILSIYVIPQTEIINVSVKNIFINTITIKKTPLILLNQVYIQNNIKDPLMKYYYNVFVNV